MLADFSKLDRVLKRDGWIIFIYGHKENGKTDFSMSLAEYCKYKKFKKHIATNIGTQSYLVEKQITDFPTLKSWLIRKGQKLYVLDEGGKHIGKYRFMSKKNVKIMELCMLIRHYDAGLIIISPSKKLIDSNVLDADIIDMIIHKQTKKRAKVTITLANSRGKLDKPFFLNNIKRTKIYFNSKDLATFTMEKQFNDTELPLCCKVAKYYAMNQSYDEVCRRLKLQRTQVKRELLKHIRHTLSNSVTGNTSRSGSTTHKTNKIFIY